jgi:hypothetical protein
LDVGYCWSILIHSGKYPANKEDAAGRFLQAFAHLDTEPGTSEDRN